MSYVFQLFDFTPRTFSRASSLLTFNFPYQMNVRSLITFTDLSLIPLGFSMLETKKHKQMIAIVDTLKFIEINNKTFFFVHMLSWVGVSQ